MPTRALISFSRVLTWVSFVTVGSLEKRILSPETLGTLKP